MKEDKQISDGKQTEKTGKEGESGGKKSNKAIAITLLVIFVLLFCLQNYLYIRQDGFKSTDFQLLNAIDYYVYFGRDFRVVSSITYPPLVYLVTMPYFSIMGMSQHAARMSLFIYWIVFLLAMFGIGYELGGYSSALVVMALSAASPHVLDYSRIYFLDFPMTAFTALAIYLLLKSDGFSSRSYSMLFGIAATLAFMSKWSAFFFLIIPLLWFLFPLIFKSKKTLVVFLVFLVTIIVTSVSTFIYYRKIMHIQSYIHFWYVHYILAFLIPVGICLFLTLILERKYKEEEDYTNSFERKIINFTLSMLPLLLIFGIWVSFAGKHIAGRYLMETTDIAKFREFYQLLTEFVSALKTMITFGIPLFITGIIFIIKEKKTLLLTFLFAFIISFLVILNLATADIDPTRYFFTVIIFLAPICGFWVKYTGKAKIYISAILVLLSLLSILAWTIIPGNLPIYYPVEYRLILPAMSFPMKILCTEPPNPTEISFEQVIKIMSPDGINSNQVSYYMIYTTKTINHRTCMAILEKLNLDIFRQGKLQGLARTEYNDYTDVMSVFEPANLRNSGVKNVILISKNGAAPEHLIKKIRYYFDLRGEIRKINIGDEFWVTFLPIQNERD